MKQRIIIALSFFIAALAFGACTGNDTSTTDPAEVAVMAKKGMVPIEAHTFQTDSGWGYTITVNSKPFIKQSIIPGVPGNKSFSTEDDAIKVAQLVIDKIKNHQVPSVTTEELKKLGVIQ